MKHSIPKRTVGRWGALTLAASMLLPAGLARADYAVGVGDVLEINVLRPEPMIVNVTVAPDGNITFPYIGNVSVRGMGLGAMQEEIQSRLADGYLKYPVLTVYLKEVKSQKYTVAGQVNKPGSYPLEDGMTVMTAISVAEGFAKYGNSSRVKLLRKKENSNGYDTIHVNVKNAQNGGGADDPELKSGDMIVVSEGLF
jgi:protein involved in polysaccharide export with SLBB domain